ncbi:MAG: lasso peptide biosynthesis protein, partial [Myxococcales bacterium]|nr:lasso peptide biosynthesis protein [Myxococcales bacterium]
AGIAGSGLITAVIANGWAEALYAGRREDGKDDEARGLERGLERLLESFDDGRKLLAKRGSPEGQDYGDRWVRHKRSRPAPRSLEQLRDAPLASLAPGKEWDYFRVSNIGLFVASIEDLLWRLTPAEAGDAFAVRRLVTNTLVEGPFALLRDSGGLDVGAGVECLSPGGSSFVCAAKVVDRNTALDILARRENGEDAGVAQLVDLSMMTVGYTIALAAPPVLLHEMLEPPLEQFTRGGAPRVARERVRQTRVIAGHELESYATVVIHEDSLSVDSEHYLFVGDRLLVFSRPELAERFLRETPAGVDALADSPEFAAASARFRDGVALQSIRYDEDLGQYALELAFDTRGVALSAHLDGSPGDMGDLGVLAQLMPEDPVTLAGLAFEPDDLEELFDEPEWERCRGHGDPARAKQAEADDGGDKKDDEPERCGLAAADKLPPIDLIEAASAAVFGWYPAVGHTLWQDWVLALPADAKLRRALPAGVRDLKAGEPRSHAGLWWLLRDEALVVASTQELVSAAAARPKPAADQDPPFGLFRFDGRRLAAVVRELGQHYGGNRREEILRWQASLIGLVTQGELVARWGEREGDRDRDSAEFTALVALNLSDTPQMGLIDRWVASPEVQNASMLPRSLGARERETTLVYRLRVANAEDFVRRAIPGDNPRMIAEVVAEDELRLTVLPSRAVPVSTSHPLSADARKAMLAADGQFRADHPKIREIVKSLKVEGDDEATAAAIVTWAHERIRYRVTPNSPDVLELIEQREGDCTEYALLTVTLLRAAGIPARLEEGMSAGGDDMGAHAWVAWYDGKRWREVDPTAGTAYVGSGHLRLEVVDVLALLSLGQFEVLAIDRLDR